MSADGSTRRVWTLRLTAIGLSLFAAVVILEIGFRFISPEPWYLRIVQEQKPERGVWRGEVDTQNTRSRPFWPPKAPDAYRLFFLGDSFTYGLGVEDIADTFVKIVQRGLNAEKPIDGIAKYQALNAGVSGSFTRHWVDLYDRLTPAFDPETVVAVFFLRVGASPEVSTIGLIQDIEEGMNDQRERSFLYQYSHLYRFFRERAEFDAVSDKYLELLRVAYVGDEEQTKEWRSAQENLLSLKRQTAAQGRRFGVVIFPVLIRLDSNHPLRGVCDIIEGFCTDNDIPVLSLLPAFMHRQASELWVSLYDQHPNEEGHMIAAEAMLPFVIELMKAR